VEGNEAVLGESSQRILLLLSSGQSLSIHEISRALGLTMETVWKDLALLGRGKQIILSDGRIQLGPEGLRLLRQWGIIKPTVASAPSPGPSRRKRPVAFVGMLPDLVIWAVVPLGFVIAVFVILGLAWALLKGVPFDERIVEIPIGLVVTVIALLLLQKYWQLSFHQIPPFESYVVFRLGNCIGSRGPGPT
jgi:hypothetical protein